MNGQYVVLVATIHEKLAALSFNGPIDADGHRVNDFADVYGLF